MLEHRRSKAQSGGLVTEIAAVTSPTEVHIMADDGFDLSPGAEPLPGREVCTSARSSGSGRGSGTFCGT